MQTGRPSTRSLGHSRKCPAGLGRSITPNRSLVRHSPQPAPLKTGLPLCGIGARCRGHWRLHRARGWNGTRQHALAPARRPMGGGGCSQVRARCTCCISPQHTGGLVGVGARYHPAYIWFTCKAQDRPLCLLVTIAPSPHPAPPRPCFSSCPQLVRVPAPPDSGYCALVSILYDPEGPRYCYEMSTLHADGIINTLAKLEAKAGKERFM